MGGQFQGGLLKSLPRQQILTLQRRDIIFLMRTEETGTCSLHREDQIMWPCAEISSNTEEGVCSGTTTPCGPA